MYDQMRDEFEDWCHAHNLKTGTDPWGWFTHPLTKEYWTVWQAAWMTSDDVHQKHGMPKLPETGKG